MDAFHMQPFTRDVYVSVGGNEVTSDVLRDELLELLEFSRSVALNLDECHLIVCDDLCVRVIDIEYDTGFVFWCNGFAVNEFKL
jgi:hypothetical protein